MTKLSLMYGDDVYIHWFWYQQGCESLSVSLERMRSRSSVNTHTHTHTHTHKSIRLCPSAPTQQQPCQQDPPQRNFNFIYLIIPVRLKNPQKAAFCSGVPSPASHSKLIFAYEHD